MRVTIIGGGIAGLAAALALALRGHEVDVLEQAPEPGEIGAGLQISPNGAVVLRALGLGPALDTAPRSTAVVLREGSDGARLLRMPLGRRAFHLCHRPALIDWLVGACDRQGVRLKFGTRVDDPGDVDGLLIGADGVHSALRPLLNGSETPRFTGQVAWRAMIEADVPAEAQVFVAPGRHLVAYPTGPGRLNLVAVEERDDWTAEGWRQPGDPDEMRARFAGMRGPVPAWLAAVERGHVWGLHLHPVAKTWADGTRALIGDAAHPTLPFLAQGANLALEDAWSLAAALDSGGIDSLGGWAARRRPRALRAIAAAAGNARAYHLDGAARTIGHLGLRALDRVAPRAMLARFGWLYDHDVTAQDW